ncbi:MAG: hypothetical protein OMM_00557 [Candidatus Magnetoglobus multicellularis str. Araruama]|uniref:Phage tail tape measure protein n=1 Tax=Candidatus Magnetoglobus multicellularis str. Araruama TaxID=890399 RepID=A0A1V1PGR1_9BACT|nr:MAG: hypothetical protein OMM_00557 [Candidatus Magnetoglobus multicellularis str. Araruama]
MQHEVTSLFTSLGFKFDKATLEDFNKAIETAEKTLKRVVLAAAAASTALFAFTKKMAESNDFIGKFSDRIDVALHTVQELGYVAELFGSSSNTMNSALEALSENAGNAAIGMGSGIEAFSRLGVSVLDANGQIKKTDQLLYEVSDALLNVNSQSQKLELIRKLGLSPELLLMIESGSDEIKRLREEGKALGFVMTQEMATSAANFNDALLDVMKILRGFSNVLSTRLMKKITPYLKLIKQFYLDHREIIKLKLEEYFDKISQAMNILYSSFSRLWAIAKYLTDSLGGLKNTLLLISGILVGINIKALLVPALIAAMIVSLIALFDEIRVYSEGGDSVLGKLTEEFPMFGRIVENTSKIVKKSIEGWKLLLDDKNWSDIFLGIKLYYEDAKKIIYDTIEAFPLLQSAITRTGKFLTGFFEQSIYGWELLLDSEVWDELFLLFEDLMKSISFDSVKNSMIEFFKFMKQCVKETIDALKKNVSELFSLDHLYKVIEDLKRYTDIITNLFSFSSTDNNIELFSNLAKSSQMLNNNSPFPMSSSVITSHNISHRVQNRSTSTNYSDNKNIVFNISGGDLSQIKATIADTLSLEYQAAEVLLREGTYDS